MVGDIFDNCCFTAKDAKDAETRGGTREEQLND
jgi:hypothetical protein